jgi:hypothetical protein
MKAKGLTGAGPASRTTLLSISDERWTSIASNVPEALSESKSEQLREAVLASCSEYLTLRAASERAAATAAAVRRPGKRQLAHLEQLANGLRTAANAWEKIGRKIHDDRLSDLKIYDGLEQLAGDAERRLRGIRELGAAVHLKSPWPQFVRRVADSCRKAGLQPTATGALYDEARRKPSWFQEFVVSINDHLLGDLGGRRHSRSAQFAEIAKALRGDAKRGKARS